MAAGSKSGLAGLFGAGEAASDEDEAEDYGGEQEELYEQAGLGKCTPEKLTALKELFRSFRDEDEA